MGDMRNPGIGQKPAERRPKDRLRRGRKHDRRPGDQRHGHIADADVKAKAGQRCNPRARCHRETLRRSGCILAKGCMRHNHAFRLSGRPGCIDQIGRILRLELWQWAGRCRIGTGHVDADQPCSRNRILGLRVGQADFCPGIGDHLRQPQRRKRRVERQVNPARLQDRQKCHHPVDGPFQTDRDHIALHHPLGPQTLRQRGAAIRQGGIAQAFSALLCGQGIRALRHLPGEMVQHMVRGRSGQGRAKHHRHRIRCQRPVWQGRQHRPGQCIRRAMRHDNGRIAGPPGHLGQTTRTGNGSKCHALRGQSLGQKRLPVVGLRPAGPVHGHQQHQIGRPQCGRIPRGQPDLPPVALRLEHDNQPPGRGQQGPHGLQGGRHLGRVVGEIIQHRNAGFVADPLHPARHAGKAAKRLGDNRPWHQQGQRHRRRRCRIQHQMPPRQGQADLPQCNARLPKTDATAVFGLHNPQVIAGSETIGQRRRFAIG